MWSLLTGACWKDRLPQLEGSKAAEARESQAPTCPASRPPVPTAGAGAPFPATAAGVQGDGAPRLRTPAW